MKDNLRKIIEKLTDKDAVLIVVAEELCSELIAAGYEGLWIKSGSLYGETHEHPVQQITYSERRRLWGAIKEKETKVRDLAVIRSSGDFYEIEIKVNEEKVRQSCSKIAENIEKIRVRPYKHSSKNLSF